MKRRIVILTVTLLLSMLCSSVVFGLDHNFDKEPIIVAGDEYFPPFEYVDTNGVYKGFNIDIMHAIAIEMGLDVEIHPRKWKDVRDALDSGEIDVIQGITYTVEREKDVSFSKPYLVSSMAIFIDKENGYIKSLRDLQNKTVSVQEEDVANELVATIPGVKVIRMDSQYDALKQLINGHAEAYVGNRLTGLYSIQKYQYSEQVKVIGSPINPKDYCIGVKKGNEDLLQVMDEGLEIIKRNGTYDKIYDKWFGEEIFSTREALKNYIYMFLVAVSVLAAIVFFNMRINKLLRAEVVKRTKEIEESDLFKEHIINSISGGLITFDTIGIVLSVNKNVSEICQIDANISVGLRIHETPFSDFIDTSSFFNALKTGESYVGCESTVSIGNRDRLMEYNIFPIKDADNIIRGITVTFRDVTLSRLNTEQIKRRDKFESIGRLTANIAHEIRNPLTAIKTYIELIPRKINNEAFQEQIVKDVPQVIERLNDLITELLEYARPREAQKTLFALDRPIIEVMSLIEGELRKNGIALDTKLTPNCYVLMDSQQFKQILINLLINAIEAVKHKDKPTIIIQSKKNDDGFIVEVIDNGVGIPEEDLSVIFEPFFTKKSSGTGLGLSIAQQLAEENGGLLTVRSIYEKGTNMRLFLPAPEAVRREDT